MTRSNPSCLIIERSDCFQESSSAEYSGISWTLFIYFEYRAIESARLQPTSTQSRRRPRERSTERKLRLSVSRTNTFPLELAGGFLRISVLHPQKCPPCKIRAGSQNDNFPRNTRRELPGLGRDFRCLSRPERSDYLPASGPKSEVRVRHRISFPEQLSEQCSASVSGSCHSVAASGQGGRVD